MKFRFPLIACTFAMLALAARAAADAQQSQAAADLAACLDEAVVAVLAIDLERLDLDAIAKAAAEGSPADAASGAAAQALLKYLQPMAATFREHGATTVYAAFSLHDIGRRMPYLVVPASSGEKAEQLAALLEGRTSGRRSQIEAYFQAFTRGNMAVAGNEDLEQRLDPARVPDRGDGLSQALAAKSSAALRIVCVPTNDQRRVLKEMLPAFPQEFGGISGAQIADGLAWASLGVDLERASLQGILEATGEESAQVLAKGIERAISSGAAVLASMGSENAMAAAVGSLKTQVNGRRIVLSSTPPEGAQKSAALMSLMRRLAPAAREIDVRNSLKQLGLAMHNFHDVYGGFPPSASYDDSGKPLLSWRVYVLPFLEQSELYGQFHLNEPWDSPHNRTLIEKMPDVFASEHFDLNMAGKTTLLLPIGEKTAFHGREGIAIRDITDGTSNTIMVLDVPHDQAVVWTKPEDFNTDQPNALERLLVGREKFWTTLFDGSARAISNTISRDTLRKLFMNADGEVVGEF